MTMAKATLAMNNANAWGFVVLGAAMVSLPFLVPAWFHHLAMDGSSTRALWCETVGSVQFLLGAVHLLRQGAIATRDAIRGLADVRGAVATADWQGDSFPRGVVAVDFARRASVRLPVTHRLPASAPMAFAGDAAKRWLALGRVGGGEARLTNLVGRAGEVRQAA
jgi:hypothetical protein